MTKKNATKRALVASVLSLLLCLSMLVGSTFAWFTDSASTGVNTIQAGNLKIDFMMWDGDSWENAEGDTLDFVAADGRANDEIFWEPGATYELPKVKLVNSGDLALQFKMFINSIAGGDMKLAEVLEVVVNDNELTKADGVTPVTLKDIMADSDGAAHGVILPEGKAAPENQSYITSGQSAELTIALHMAEEAGNEYQGLVINGLALTAYASQYTYEKDMTDDQYDKGAVVDFSELTGESAKELSGNISVNNMNVTLTSGSPDFSIGDSNLIESDVTEITINGGVINTAFMANPNPNNTDWPATYTANGSKINLNVPANTKVVFRNITINGFYSFLVGNDKVNGLTLEFENCTLNGCWASQTAGLKNIAFKNCRFTLEGIETEKIKNTNPLWLAPDKVQTLTIDGCTVEGNRPIKYAADQPQPYTTDVTLNVTNSVFKLTPTAFDTQANRLDRLTAVRFDDDVITVNVTGNTLISGYAFYQTNNFGSDYEGFVDSASNNNKKPDTAKWCIEY